MKVRAISSGLVHDIDDRRDLIRAGGEGGVYRLRNEPLLVAKIYHEPNGRRPKLEAMLKNPPIDDGTPGHKSIAWPTDLLVDAGKTKRFCGFLMPKVDRASGFHEFSNPSRREKQHPHVTFRDLYIVASNVASAFRALHQKGYVIGDVNEGNVLIRDDGLATVVDTDSFQVRTLAGTVYRCKVGRAEFTPPELQNAKSLGDFDRETRHDIFGLGVLLFQLLMQGFHPFSGSPTFQGEAWTLDKRIAQGNFAWDGSSKPFRIPPLAPRLQVLDPKLQKLFSETFDRLSVRPSARTWKRELDDAIERLRPCGRDKAHQYGRHLQSCPWCELDEEFASTRRSTSSKPKAVTVSAPAQRSIPVSMPTASIPAISRSGPSYSPASLRAFLQMPTAAAPPLPALPPAEITPGSWRLHPANPIVRLLSALASDERYDLLANGTCVARGVINVMGNSCEFTADGQWSYQPSTKLLLIDGIVRVTGANFRSPLLGLLANVLPPRPLTKRMTVIDSGPAGATLRDESDGTNFLFERL